MDTLAYQTARTILTDASSSGLAIALDALQESEDRETSELGEVLREWYNIQTNIRMYSKAQIGEFSKRLNAFNNSYALHFKDSGNTYWHKYILGPRRYSYYYNPIGPLYTGLRTVFNELMANLEILEAEPIRYLHIAGCKNDNDTAALLRNHRIQRLYTLRLRFHRPRGDILIAGMLKANLKLYNAYNVHLEITNPNRIVSSAVLPILPKGCELIVGGQTFRK